MQKIWFIFNFTTLALLIWDVINASPRQLISLCRKLSPPFHQNSVTLAPACTVMMQLGYRGNPKVSIFFLFLLVLLQRGRSRYATRHIHFFPAKKNLIYFSWGHAGVNQPVWNRLLMNTSIQHRVFLFPTLVPPLGTEWLPRILSCYERCFKVLLWERAYLSKGIYINEKCRRCWGLRERGRDSPPLPLSQTHTLRHVFNACVPFIPPTPTVKWLNILINCI